MNWKKIGIGISVLGIIQFFILTSLAMYYYPGGVLHDRTTVGYSFFTNFFSDLGRTVALNRQLNTTSHYIFKTALTLTGISMFCFFSVLPTLFKNKSAKILAILTMLAGFGAAYCYVGIAFHPLNGTYWEHRFYVRTGFLCFLLCISLYAFAIRYEPLYPNKYSNILVFFGLILMVQIGVMLLGPKSWQSPFALWLQVVCQKVIVYGEIICMLIQSIGAYQMTKRLQIID